MSRRVRDLTLDRLGDLPAPCRGCVFWEAAGPSPGSPDRARAIDGKQAWWSAAQLEWGTPGKAVYVDDELVAYAIFAPGAHFARARRLGRLPSEDALLLATLWVCPQQRGGGLGRLLVQTLLREAHRSGVRALEAYGSRGAVDAEWQCRVPEGFLQRQGFAVVHEHPDVPLLRLDLRQTVRWQESVGHALESVAAALSRRERAPRTAPEARAAGVRR